MELSSQSTRSIIPITLVVLSLVKRLENDPPNHYRYCEGLAACAADLVFGLADPGFGLAGFGLALLGLAWLGWVWCTVRLISSPKRF